MNKLICKICNRKFKSFIGLGLHIIQKHKIKSKDYYDLFVKNKYEDICNKSGCNNNTTYMGLNEGYCKFCSYKCRSNTKKFKNSVSKTHKNKKSSLKGKTYEEIHGRINGTLLRKSKSKIRKGVKASDKTKERLRKTIKEKGLHKGTKNSMYGKRHCKNVCDKQKKYMLEGGASHARSFVRRQSKPQIELFNIVSEIAPYPILEYPCLNKSIDIAIPILSIAIEYDG